MNSIDRRVQVLTTTFIASVLACASPGHAADFTCPSGDVPCLITAIEMANANGEANTITLETGTYSLTTVNNVTDGPNGLPSVVSTLTVRGTEDGVTIIERLGGPTFRIFHVAATGSLTLERVVITHGRIFPPVDLIPTFNLAGAGLLNRGTLILANSSVETNTVIGGFLGRGVGAGIANGGGTLLLRNSTVTDNGTEAFGGGIANNGGAAIVINSTVAGNRSFGTGGAGLVNNSGTVLFLNSTVADNTGGLGVGGGGLANFGGPVTLQNTVLARNTNGSRPPDCDGPITSLGTNLIGNTKGCTITLLPSDITGDPGLGAFVGIGTPGGGHNPLLATSPAIDAGNDAFCQRSDQLDQPRTGACDIGAVEFKSTALMVRPLTIQAGGTLTVSWNGIAEPSSTDWIGVFAPGAANTSFLEWMYVSCSQSPGTAQGSGTCPFVLPASLGSGTYELRLLANDQFTHVLATSGTLKIAMH
jgi:hypothetical protein